MTLVDLIILLVVAGIAGSIGQALGGDVRGGCLTSIILGFIGALIGMWLARELGLPTILSISIGGTTFPIVWSVIGSALFVAVLALFRRRR
ncbi:MAG: GlsB/YeaQ/YmgE family stress response membrane protein [Saprospiraceae bacterium]|nr:GlsB/YeaQ/YmgE family stress response membrane protein [Saprospiraceae bacterium]